MVKCKPDEVMYKGICMSKQGYKETIGRESLLRAEGHLWDAVCNVSKVEEHLTNVRDYVPLSKEEKEQLIQAMEKINNANDSLKSEYHKIIEPLFRREMPKFSEFLRATHTFYIH